MIDLSSKIQTACSSVANQLFEQIDKIGLQEFVHIPEIYNNNKDLGFMKSFYAFANVFKDHFAAPLLKNIVESDLDVGCKYLLSYDYFRKYINLEGRYQADDQNLFIKHNFSSKEDMACVLYTGMALQHEQITYSIIDNFMSRKLPLNKDGNVNFKPIPKELVSIWFTDSREMFDGDLENMIKTKKLLGSKWTYALYTNDENLIPISTAKLRANGIEVRSIDSLLEHEATEITASGSFTTDQFDELSSALTQLKIVIEQSRHGISGNLGRLFINKARGGGCYADANFAFSRTFDEEVEKYDSVMNNPDSNFFCFAENHPAVDWALSKTVTNLINTPHYLDVKLGDPTTLISFLPYFISNILYLNKNSSDYVCSYYKECSIIGIDNAGDTHQTWSLD